MFSINSGDRFIPSRSETFFDFNVGRLQSPQQSSPIDPLYEDRLLEAMAGMSLKERDPILWCHDTPRKKLIPRPTVWVKKNTEESISLSSKLRKINPLPSQILDAPKFINDFYRQPISGTHSGFCIALDNQLFVYDLLKHQIQAQIDAPASITAVCQNIFHSEQVIFSDMAGNISRVHLEKIESRWDKTITAENNPEKINSAVSASENTFYLGSDSGRFYHVDIRSASIKPLYSWKNNQIVKVAKGSNNYFAVGNNSGTVSIWDLRMAQTPIMTYSHTYSAGVRALTFVPWNSELVVSGGGLQDKKIYIANITKNQIVSRIQTSAQVTDVIPSQNSHREFLSCHGGNLDGVNKDCGAIKLWQYTSDKIIKPIADLQGHVHRTLSGVITENGQTLVTTGGDESIRIWKSIFPEKRKPVSSGSLSFESQMTIR